MLSFLHLVVALHARCEMFANEFQIQHFFTHWHSVLFYTYMNVCNKRQLSNTSGGVENNQILMNLLHFYCLHPSSLSLSLCTRQHNWDKYLFVELLQICTKNNFQLLVPCWEMEIFSFLVHAGCWLTKGWKFFKKNSLLEFITASYLSLLKSGVVKCLQRGKINFICHNNFFLFLLSQVSPLTLTRITKNISELHEYSCSRGRNKVWNCLIWN